MRYFYHDNASQPVMIGSRQVQFEVVDRVVGKMVGIHAAEGGDADTLAELVRLRRGLIEISEGDYAKLQAQKKTTPISNSLNSWRNSSRPVVQPGSAPQQPLAERKGVVSAGGNLPPPESVKPEFPEVKDVLKVEAVAPPQPIVEGDRRIGESKRRGKSK